MNKTYRTSEVAGIIGIHPNTVRLYESLEFIPKPKRLPNGYRVFNDMHLQQFVLARMALKVEVLHNGLRKKAIEIIKISATGDYDQAIRLTEKYLHQIRDEQRNAKEAIRITGQLLNGSGQFDTGISLTRKETADILQIRMDALRNWEMNGLLKIKRRKNGYRVYTDADLRLLRIIRALRCANYSLASILRMLNALSANPQADIREIINTPDENEDVISVCDKLLTSLRQAELYASDMLDQIKVMKIKFT